MANKDQEDIRLTSDQEKQCSFALKGHNACITGRAGTGKSVVAAFLQKSFARTGKKVVIIGASGLSCEVYQAGKAKTVHSHYGLQTAELPYEKLIDRSLARNNVFNQVKSADIIIWDEISMSSKRIVEIANRIQHLVFQNNMPFGGKQFILVGDFWQLSPIPSAIDAGHYAFLAQIFNVAFPHRFELVHIIRQDESQASLRVALNHLRYPQCPSETEQYIQSLAREIFAEESLHIYFKRLPVEVHNFNTLLAIPGEMFTFRSDDKGNSAKLDRIIGKVINLKEGCNVMLLYNINDQLRNGSTGVLCKVEEDHLLVDFPKVGKHKITRQTWYSHNVAGTVLGSRTQFPIVPCYATTVHKSQGMTLDSAIVHCTSEFVSGQTYVALSRVKKEDNMQVIGFRQSFLLPLPEKLLMFNPSHCESPLEDKSCCINQSLDESLFVVQDREADEMLSGNDDPVFDDQQELLVRQYYETVDDNDPVSLEEVYISLDEMTNKVSTPPESFSHQDFLKSFLFDHDDPLSKSINDEVNVCLCNLENFKLLINILWCRIFLLFKEFLLENMDSINITSKNFCDATAKVNEIFISSEYRRDLATAFGKENWHGVTGDQQALGAQMVLQLFQLFINEVTEHIRLSEVSEPVHVSVEKMCSDGKGKIRYIGGWAVRKVLESCRRYVMNNRFSTMHGVRTKLMREMRKIDLLEDDVIAAFQSISGSTSSPETLNVTEAKQFRGRGLLHISDEAFHFFLQLEQERVDQINHYRLLHERENMVEAALITISSNEELQSNFRQLFQTEKEEDKMLIQELFNDVTTRYVRMGAGQFIKDFRRDFKIKKAAAHRKAVMQKKEKANEKKIKVPLSQIEQDTSPGKKTTHARLLAFLTEFKEAGLVNVYNKEELKKICISYNVPVRSNWVKRKLASELARAINQNNYIPSHELLNNYRVEMDNGGDRPGNVPVLRLRRI